MEKMEPRRRRLVRSEKENKNIWKKYLKGKRKKKEKLKPKNDMDKEKRNEN